MKKYLLILPLFVATPAMAKSHGVIHHVVKFAKRAAPVAVGTIAGEWVYHKFVETPVTPPPPVVQQEGDDDRYYSHSSSHDDDEDDDRYEHMSYRDRINSGYTGP